MGLERLLRTLGSWPTITFAWVLATIAFAWVLKTLLRLLRSQQLLQKTNPKIEGPMNCCCCKMGAHKHTEFEFSGLGACPSCLAHSIIPIRISAKMSNTGTPCTGCSVDKEVGPHLQPRYRVMVLVWMPVEGGLTEQLQPDTLESNPLMGEATTPPVEVEAIGGMGPGSEHFIRTISLN